MSQETSQHPSTQANEARSSGIDPDNRSVWDNIAEIKAALDKQPTAGPWFSGHLCDDNHRCNCASILSDTGIMGGVATVHYDNGLPIGEGGNDAPPVAEAKANQMFIAAANPVAVAQMIELIETQAARLKELGENVS